MDARTIIEAIKQFPDKAAAAVETLPPPPGQAKPLTAAGLDGAAASLGRDRAKFWVDQLRSDGHLQAFIFALRARGVAFPEDALADPDAAIRIDKLSDFLPRAKAFRCKVLVNGKIKGSGVLVGPSLVLTSWHVIATKKPGEPGNTASNVAVQLSDKTKQAALVPARFQSECGDDEFQWIAPTSDAQVVDRNDVALLAMDRPVAAHLGFVPLTAPAPVPTTQSRVVLVHFPGGEDVGVDFGLAGEITNVTARWAHDITTKGGSSGGACFDQELRYVGIHQGEFDTAGRFVPVDRFLAQVLEYVKKDTTPPTLWSLDGTVTGQLVVARDLFFEAIAAAGETSKRVRGIRIKRKEIDAGAAGLAFSHDILEKLLPRKGPNHILVRVTQDEIVPDLVADIRRRVRLKGLTIPEPATEPGVALGQAPPETTAKDRAAILAAAIEAAAAATDQTIWVFFDNPTVALTEAARLAFEGFVDAALVQPHLRLVIAGFETLSLSGQEFAGASPPEGDRSPGLVIEFLGGFRRSDLLNLMTRASQELTGTADQPTLEAAVTRALVNLPNFNDTYADEQLATVDQRLRLDLEVLRGQAAGGGG